MTRRRDNRPSGRRQLPDFGLDAPYVVVANGLLALAGAALIILGVTAGSGTQWPGIAFLAGGSATAGLMTYSSRVGKVRARDRLLGRLQLTGGEHVLDLGCGSGLMLLAAAQRLTTGHATGIDRWRARDQAGATAAQCHENARILGVNDRITLIDADMAELPFPPASFDLVLASLALHNLHPASRRQQAVREAIRVLRPGGRMLILDIAGTKLYTRTGRSAGLAGVQRSGFVAGIWPPARLVTGRQPTDDQRSP